jgi:hypothetical protein
MTASVRRLNVLQDYRPHIILLLAIHHQVQHSEVLQSVHRVTFCFTWFSEKNSDYLPMQQRLINFDSTEPYAVKLQIQLRLMFFINPAKPGNFVEAQHI